MQTLREYNAAIKKLMNQLPEELNGTAMLSAGNGLVRRMKDRIFNQGLDWRNKIIQDRYSTTPVYVAKKQFAKPSAFKPIGKTGLPTKKTMYFKEGYKGLRQAQGLQTSRVNWLYSGRTRRAFVARQQDGRLVIGFNTELAARIRKGLEKRARKKVFKVSKEESLEFKAALIRHLRAVNRKYLAK